MAAAPFDKLKILANLSINRSIWLLIIAINFYEFKQNTCQNKISLRIRRKAHAKPMPYLDH